MSQILRLSVFRREFINICANYTQNTYACKYFNNLKCGYRPNLDHEHFSTASKSLPPKKMKFDSKGKKTKHKQFQEEERKIHLGELAKTFQTITEKYSTGKNSRQELLNLQKNAEANLASLSSSEQTLHTTDTSTQSGIGSNNSYQGCSSQNISTAFSHEQFNRPHPKNIASFDDSKPFVNEAITSSEALPSVQKVGVDGNKSKKRKRMTKKAKRMMFKRLFATHPYIEHMQVSESVSPTPEMIEELRKLLHDGNLSPDLKKDISAYLETSEAPESSAKQTKKEVKGKQKQKKKSQNVTDSMPLWTPEDLQSSDKMKDITSQAVKLFALELNKQAKKRAVEADAQKRIDLYHREAAAYVDACILTGMLARAQVLLVGPSENKKKRGRRKIHKNITDVNVFNTMVHAWAKRGRLEPIRELFEHMEREGLTPTLQSYAGVLECMGNQRQPAVDVIENVLGDIESRGFKVDDICLACHLREDELNSIKKALSMVSKEVNLHLTEAPEMDYNCDLLKDLPNTPQENPSSGVLTMEQLANKAQEQLTLELEDKVIVKSIVPEVKVTPQIQQARDRITKTKSRWQLVLRHGFLREVEKLEKRAKDDFTTGNLLPYMRIFPADSFVDLMIQQIVAVSQEMESFSPPMSAVHSTLGYRVFHRIQLHLKQKHKQVSKMSELYARYLEAYSKETSDCNLRQVWQSLQTEHADGTSLVYPVQRWPNHVAKSVGRFLMNVIMNEVKVDANIFKPSSEKSEVPAFYSVSRNRNNIPQEEIMPHPVLVRLQKEAQTRDLIFSPQDMPSLVPPVPWSAVDIGGNLLCTTDLIKNAAPDFNVHQQVSSQQLYPVFDALNAVSAVPWMINQPVLDTIIEVFNNGGNPDIDIPEPSSKSPPLPKFSQDMTPEERMAVIFERNKINKKKKEMFSLWCTEQYRLSIANKHRDEIFWFAHNLDFRSRFYAVPPHFNHLGSDVARSMLQFAKGKPLGKNGLDWLKIHLINLTGFKKRSPNQERLAYADEIMDDILDSADNPLTGRKWWQTSDEPWQTLACCMEIAKAMRSPDHQQYICHYPVHQDGSCNGLQHYAALGRDRAGAESVNLRPFDSPKDVYSDVVELVEQERERDAADGNKVALALDGFVRRKVIKQTIMTTVYGVTKFGARQQIRGQLDDIPDFQQKFAFDGMFYLTDKTFFCLQQMFTSTKEIQEWFVVCADLISRICYKPVEWVTPVGWPVLQPYYRYTRIHNPDKPDKYISVEKPNPTKQKNAFPPNFIHSLDSTHMMLTSINCDRQGVNFVAVHDCFWTHACDVHVMNKVCREQFVALHKQPILEDLAIYLLDKYGFSESDIEQKPRRVAEAKRYLNAVLGKLPLRGSFDIDDVLDSTYFFS